MKALAHRKLEVFAGTLAGILVSGLLLAAPVTAAPAQVAWRSLRPGLDFALIEDFPSARGGSPRVALLRIDPERYRFQVLSADNGQAGRSAGAWREASGALAVFNAGLYVPEKTYLGHLVKDGKVLSRAVPQQDGFFIAEPTDPALPRARVVDQRYTAYDPDNSPYRQVAQSLMLLDRFGQVRVRRSAKLAHRTALALDDKGRILVIVTEGVHTLWELAQALKNSGLGLREVMSMDGGPESQLDLAVDGFSYQQYGAPGATPDLPWPRTALPVALAVFAR